MKKIVLTILLLTTFAQTKGQSDKHIISLNPDSVFESLQFSCSEVIDARKNKKNIGFVQKGIANKIIIAQLNDGFTAHIKQTINKLVPNNKPQITLIFRFFLITENTNPDIEESYCKIEIEFAKRADSNLFSLGIFDSHIIGGGLDVTSKHPKRILKAIQECFSKFERTNWKNKNGTLIKDIEHGYNYDYKEIPPKGVYLSYGQLASKQPTKNANYKIIKRYNFSKNYNTYTLKFDNIDDNYVNYVSNDTNIYMRINNNNIFIKSKQHGKFIYFTNKIPGGVTFGEFFGFSNASFTNTGLKKGIILNTETGRVSIVSNFTLYNLLKPYPHILKKYRASKRKLTDKENAIINLNKEF